MITHMVEIPAEYISNKALFTEHNGDFKKCLVNRDKIIACGCFTNDVDEWSIELKTEMNPCVLTFDNAIDYNNMIETLKEDT